jgi:hypothetical protein
MLQGGRIRAVWGAAFAVVSLVASATACDDGDDLSFSELTTPPEAETTAPPGASSSTTPTTVYRAPLPTTTSLPPAATALNEELVPEAEEIEHSFEGVTMNGVAYTNALLLVPYEDRGRVEINAGRSRRVFTGDFGIPDNAPSSSAYKVDISLDTSAPVYSAEIRFGETKKFSIDVTNVLRIKITVTTVTEIPCCDGSLGIGNPRFE